MKKRQKPGSISPLKDFPPSFKCQFCNETIFLKNNFIDLYFYDEKYECSNCNKVLNPWDIAFRLINERFLLSSIFYPLGSKTNIFKTKIYPNTETIYNLYDEGLPKDALILDLNLTPNGMFCTEVTGNNRRQRNKGGALQLFVLRLK